MSDGHPVGSIRLLDAVPGEDPDGDVVFVCRVATPAKREYVSRQMADETWEKGNRYVQRIEILSIHENNSALSDEYLMRRINEAKVGRSWWAQIHELRLPETIA